MSIRRRFTVSQINRVINGASGAIYTIAIASQMPSIATGMGCLAFALTANVAVLLHRKNLSLAGVERRAALLRAASGHPESERLVQRALCQPLTERDVKALFGDVCEIQESVRRSLVTRQAETTIAAALNAPNETTRVG